MNRTTKFRAWDGKKMTTDFCLESDGEIITLRDNGYDGLEAMPRSSWILMQYTGINDKEGTPVFEGDIIEYTQHMFNTENTRIERKQVKWAFDRWNIYETNAGESDIKVIGNVHQNKANFFKLVTNDGSGEKFLEKLKYRIEHREEIREQQKKELKELLKKDNNEI
jgi:hypothetical protein